MRVGIIADRLDRPLTGIGNYVQNILHEFSQMSTNIAFNTIRYKKSEEFDNINEIILANPFEGLMKKSYYPWHLYMQLSLRMKPVDLDVLHCPESASIFTQIPDTKKIITVYDTTPVLFPETFTKGTLLRYKILFSKSISSSDMVISISNSTKQDLIRYFHVPEDKITVIHLAADDCYQVLPHSAIQIFRDRYKLDYPFILYVGTLEPRKNLSTVIKAFYQLKKEGLKHKLVIAGGKGWKYNTIFQLVSDLNLEKDVCFTGYVPKNDLPALYNAADVFVYPSLYEGFGLPPLEAMACGCPVITSNTSSLPEVVGDAGIMINPHDYEKLAEAIDSVLSGVELKKQLSKMGQARAAEFSWKRCAKETCKVYNDLI
ncbi:glycosyl transferase family 1 [Methanoculleus taiwanensis]|uniref:Glycosyl transferase family 1 n=1 Tax=Methanoculleus taiwanensis TaxID=1550565 RepID=A0A498GZ31_9EURY|nr:glycosyltransferase family 1 protein [Methanoculleus taiwanensis]RXE55921.1 glycosyl transferase family 1 [Methanoculleus taiwanensis]